MAGNTQMNENERNVFGLHGVVGYFIAVALLLSILAILTVSAISAQKNNAENYYTADFDQLKAGCFTSSGAHADGSNNYKLRKDNLNFNGK